MAPNSVPNQNPAFMPKPLDKKIGLFLIKTESLCQSVVFAVPWGDCLPRTVSLIVMVLGDPGKQFPWPPEPGDQGA